MKRFMIRRVAHCNEGHAKVLDMTENCPPHIIRIPERVASAETPGDRTPHRLFPDLREEA